MARGADDRQCCAKARPVLKSAGNEEWMMSEALAIGGKMTVEEFFAWQKRQDKNYELVDGVPVLPLKSMTGATRRHDMVTVNAIIALGNKLRGTPCRPSTSDQSVVTYRGTRRPDVSVECGRGDDRSMSASEPRVVIEVMSPSTWRFDRIQKLDEYRRQPAIRVVLLVDTEAPRVVVWRRGAEGWASENAEGLDALIDLPEIGTALALSELFEGLEFPPPEPA